MHMMHKERRCMQSMNYSIKVLDELQVLESILS